MKSLTAELNELMAAAPAEAGPDLKRLIRFTFVTGAAATLDMVADALESSNSAKQLASISKELYGLSLEFIRKPNDPKLN